MNSMLHQRKNEHEASGRFRARRDEVEIQTAGNGKTNNRKCAVGKAGGLDARKLQTATSTCNAGILLQLPRLSLPVWLPRSFDLFKILLLLREAGRDLGSPWRNRRPAGLREYAHSLGSQEPPCQHPYVNLV